MTAAPAEHCASYYAATANDRTTYSALEGSERADVAVIGAGFTGISTALTLAERGYSVAVIEANRVGWGASGRNGGQLIGGISGQRKIAHSRPGEIGDLLWEMAWRGHEIIHRRVEQYRIACDLKAGYVDTAIKPRHWRALVQAFEELQARAFPYPYRLVDATELEALIGTRAYIGGLVNMRNGHLHPLNLCLGEARAAAGLGVRIFERSAVTRIVHGEPARISTGSGEVTADAVVLAGNAYHALERRHLSGLVFPAGSFIIATEPLPAEVVAEINPQDLAVCDPNNILDYFRLSADRRLLFGGRCNYSGREPRSIQRTMAPRMVKIYPRLAGTRIDYEWGGKIGIVINRIPLIGRIGGNVYYAQGYSGHGLNVTHLAGEILADAIAGTLERFDVFAGIRHLRVPLGQWFGNQMLALGMLYYRLKDLL